MKITYHTGPNRNRYCKIKVNRGDFNYDIDGIVEGSRDTPERRRDLLLQIIARNGGILHTHVIKIVYEQSGMAKKTVENELERMEEDKILESEKDGDGLNALRHWSIRAPESDIEKGAKKHVENIVKSVEKYVTRVERIYPKLNDSLKAWVMMHLLQAIHNFQPLVEVINQEYNVRQNKRRFDKLVTRAYKILENEKRDYFDGRPILRRLLDLRSSQPMIEMNNFLSEIKN